MTMHLLNMHLGYSILECGVSTPLFRDSQRTVMSLFTRIMHFHSAPLPAPLVRKPPLTSGPLRLVDACPRSKGLKVSSNNLCLKSGVETPHSKKGEHTSRRHARGVNPTSYLWPTCCGCGHK